MRKVLALVLLFASPAWAACTSNAWCEIYSSSPTHFANNGWNNPVYSPDNNLFYLNMSDGSADSPFSNAYFSYSLQPATLAAGVNPWQEVSSCGNNDTSSFPTGNPGSGMVLAESITATTGTCSGGCTASDYVHLQLDGGAGQNLGSAASNPSYAGNTTNGTGVVWVGNEAIRYGKCTTTASFSGTACGATTGGNFYLWGTSNGTSSGTQAALTRGTRQTAGWGAAVAHQGGTFSHGGGEPAGWACYNPALGTSWPFTPSPTNIAGTDHDTGVSRSGSWDAPPERHPVAGFDYDSKRGRLWVNTGFVEAWGMQDTWSLCVANKGGAGGGDALSICGANDIYTATSTTPGWQRVPWPGTNPANPPYYSVNASGTTQNTGMYESASIYDPHNDVLVEVGGLYNNNPHQMWILCLASTSTGYGCTSGTAGTWINLKPTTSQCNTANFYCGDMGARDGARLAFDPVSNRIMIFGGESVDATKTYTNVVAQFDAHSGDVCNSSLADNRSGDTFANTTNVVSWCPLPTVSGAPPEKNGSGVCNGSLKFPAWTYDSGLTKFAYYGGNGDGTVGNGGCNADDPSTAGIWFYNPVTNAWTQPTYSPPVGGSGWPKITAYTAMQGWAYDSSTDAQLMWENGTPGNTLWQIPDTALGGTAPTTFTLSITIAGSGSGSVTDTNNGFSCSSGTCTHTYIPGTSISLTDTVSGGSAFAGWSANSGSATCSGTTVPCTFTITANSGTTGTFNPPSSTTHQTVSKTSTTIKR